MNEREELEQRLEEAKQNQREASMIGGPGLFEYAYTWWCRENEIRRRLAELEQTK